MSEEVAIALPQRDFDRSGIALAGGRYRYCGRRIVDYSTAINPRPSALRNMMIECTGLKNAGKDCRSWRSLNDPECGPYSETV
jgi:hypothetical protein